MKSISFLCFLVFFGITIVSCSKDDPDPSFQNRFSFKLDDMAYSFSEFEISYDSIDQRIFVRRDEGDDIFTFNLLIDLPVGVEHPMNWHEGISFFNAKIPGGNFLTVDSDDSKLIIQRHDTEKKQIEVTFQGIGLQSLSLETRTISEGVLNVQY